MDLWEKNHKAQVEHPNFAYGILFKPNMLVWLFFFLTIISTISTFTPMILCLKYLSGLKLNVVFCFCSPSTSRFDWLIFGDSFLFTMVVKSDRLLVSRVYSSVDIFVCSLSSVRCFFLQTLGLHFLPHPKISNIWNKPPSPSHTNKQAMVNVSDITPWPYLNLLIQEWQKKSPDSEMYSSSICLCDLNVPEAHRERERERFTDFTMTLGYSKLIQAHCCSCLSLFEDRH